MAEPRVQLELTVEQAQAVAQALDVLCRLGIGQFRQIPELVRNGMIPVFAPGGGPRAQADADACNAIDDLAAAIGRELGYPRNGSHGIGHAHVSLTAHRAYEVMKVLQKTLAEHANPAPEFKGVNYDGLVLRYTQDPAPTAHVVKLD